MRPLNTTATEALNKQLCVQAPLDLCELLVGPNRTLQVGIYLCPCRFVSRKVRQRRVYLLSAMLILWMGMP